MSLNKPKKHERQRVINVSNKAVDKWGGPDAVKGVLPTGAANCFDEWLCNGVVRRAHINDFMWLEARV